MSKKIKRHFDGLVYSTDENFVPYSGEDEPETPEPRHQKLNIRLETKQRGGKKATIIKGFTGKSDDLDALARRLKAHCGTGGSVVDGEILVQGDMVQKVKAFLLAAGYKTNNI